MQSRNITVLCWIAPKLIMTSMLNTLCYISCKLWPIISRVRTAGKCLHSLSFSMKTITSVWTRLGFHPLGTTKPLLAEVLQEVYALKAWKSLKVLEPCSLQWKAPRLNSGTWKTIIILSHVRLIYRGLQWISGLQVPCSINSILHHSSAFRTWWIKWLVWWQAHWIYPKYQADKRDTLVKRAWKATSIQVPASSSSRVM